MWKKRGKSKELFVSDRQQMQTDLRKKLLFDIDTLVLLFSECTCHRNRAIENTYVWYFLKTFVEQLWGVFSLKKNSLATMAGSTDHRILKKVSEFDCYKNRTAHSKAKQFIFKTYKLISFMSTLRIVHIPRIVFIYFRRKTKSEQRNANIKWRSITHFLAASTFPLAFCLIYFCFYFLVVTLILQYEWKIGSHSSSNFSTFIVIQICSISLNLPNDFLTFVVFISAAPHIFLILFRRFLYFGMLLTHLNPVCCTE